MTELIKAHPLVVDLDGSLIKTDLLYETLIKAFYKTPWVIFFLPFWLLSGKSYLKKRLYAVADIDVAVLPWRDSAIDYIKQQHQSGRELILCTGSWQELAEKVAAYLGVFSRVFGSTDKVNLTGSNKASFLVDHYGEKQFAYLGNEAKDLKVWKVSSGAVVVDGSQELVNQAEKLCPVEASFEKEAFSFKALLKQMRVHQWVKNGLVFVALITSHQANNIELFFSVCLAFLAYSLCASATYILNDLSDLESDRKHNTKKNRPLASGAISIPQGIFLAGVLFLSSLLVSLQLPPLFGLSLLLYIVITLSYSFKLKRMQTVDIISLAILYTLRIVSGAIAISVLPSFWLLAFSMFVFLCLAIIKRLSEIIKSQHKYTEDEKISGRGYYISDFHVLMSLAIASGMLSILVFAMYINSPEVVGLYTTPYALWLICPLFAYWIIRVLIMASRGEIDEDPIVFAIKDNRSWVVGFIILVIIALSSTGVIN